MFDRNGRRGGGDSLTAVLPALGQFELSLHLLLLGRGFDQAVDDPPDHRNQNEDDEELTHVLLIYYSRFISGAGFGKDDNSASLGPDAFKFHAKDLFQSLNRQDIGRLR